MSKKSVANLKKLITGWSDFYGNTIPVAEVKKAKTLEELQDLMYEYRRKLKSDHYASLKHIDGFIRELELDGKLP